MSDPGCGAANWALSGLGAWLRFVGAVCDDGVSGCWPPARGGCWSGSGSVVGRVEGVMPVMEPQSAVKRLAPGPPLSPPRRAVLWGWRMARHLGGGHLR